MAPLGVIALALLDNKRFSFGELLGDGFLFFFAVSVIAGLVGSVAVDLTKPDSERLLTGSLAAPIIVGGSLFMCAALLTYYRALMRRYSSEPGDGKAFGYGSIAFGTAAAIFTLWVRFAQNLW